MSFKFEWKWIRKTILFWKLSSKGGLLPWILYASSVYDTKWCCLELCYYFSFIKLKTWKAWKKLISSFDRANINKAFKWEPSSLTYLINPIWSGFLISPDPNLDIDPRKNQNPNITRKTRPSLFDNICER